MFYFFKYLFQYQTQESLMQKMLVPLAPEMGNIFVQLELAFGLPPNYYVFNQWSE